MPSTVTLANVEREKLQHGQVHQQHGGYIKFGSPYQKNLCIFHSQTPLSSLARPAADVYIPFWNGGCPAAMDVTVIFPFQPFTITEAATTQGHALKVGETGSWPSRLYSCGSFLLSTCCGDPGWLEPTGRLLALRSGPPPSDSIRHLFQQLAISLWRSNAGMILNRLPTIAPSIDNLD